MYLFIYLINYSKVLEADGRRRAGRLARQRVRTAKKTPSIGAILNTGLEALKWKSAKSLRWIRHQRWKFYGTKPTKSVWTGDM